MNPISIKELMLESGVNFGTSGARGLVENMTDTVCMAYTIAFLKHLDGRSVPPSMRVLLVGGDRRPSSPRIMNAVARAARHYGYEVKNAGLVPSPALALWGMEIGASTVMVTGSHIPDDRNGMKFTTPSGEITKADEVGIKEQWVESLPPVSDDGMLLSSEPLPEADPSAERLYVERYTRAFGARALTGMRIGFYGHSAVGRDLLVQLYEALGAEIIRLGYSDTFIPVDTEAIRPEDEVLARTWAREQRLTAIVSTDGDSDRPLCSDENGKWFRGDVSGILTARFLGADAVAVPVSCNTALEKSGWVKRAIRTKIGSPYVISGLEELQREGYQSIVGYEANGGFFTQSSFVPNALEPLPPLPTRDPVIVHLSLLCLARQRGCKLSELEALLPSRFTSSGRDQSFSQERSHRLLHTMRDLPIPDLAERLGLGNITDIDETDGLRVSFSSGEIIHLRPSGNAPELRCYAEAEQPMRAQHLVELGLNLARTLTETGAG